MPGLCALVRPASSAFDPRLQLGEMLGRLHHYPWFQSTAFADSKAGIGLGVAGLKWTKGPALVQDGQTVLALDGELYGSEVSGDTQAAFLLRGFRAEGLSFLQGLHGLFNALVWNGETRELTVLTDRFGMRPIYTAQTPIGFLIASEIKALLSDTHVDRSWSEEGVAQFFSFGHFFGDATLHRGIRAVPPATALTYRVDDGRVEERQYAPAPRRANTDAQSLTSRLEATLVAAVRRRAAPGESLGLSLSGGLDARTLLGLMPPSLNLQSVSIGIEGSIDHRGAAELARLVGVPHHAYFLDSSFLGSFEQHLRSMILLTDGHYLDQGIVMTTLPMYRQLGIEALLRGHGGELLHMRKAYAFSLDNGAVEASEEQLSAWLLAHVSGYMLQGVPPELFKIDLPDLARASMRAALARTTAFERPVDRVWQLFVNERLHRETALSMHKFGCFATVRLPYIDNDVIEALTAMPASMKLGDELQTAILRSRRPEFLRVVNSNTGASVGASAAVNYVSRWRMRIAAKLGVKGYQPYERLGLWLRQDLRPLVDRVVLSDELMARGLFRPDALRKVVAQHMDQQANHTFLIMALLIFELGQRMLADPEPFARELNG